MALPIKPTGDAQWASANTAEIIEPGSTKKGLGWLGAEKPPHQYFNWWMNIVYRWQIWLDRHIRTTTLISSGLVLPTDRCRRYHVNASGGNIALVLPSISVDDDDLEIEVKKVDGSANTVMLNGQIEGDINFTLDYQWSSRTFYAFNGLWYWSK